jgi:predicted PurR-regulated permease PerM
MICLHRENSVTMNNGRNNKLVTFLALGLAGLILATGLNLFLPFFEPIAWAIILGLFFYPVYRWIRRTLKVSEALASVGMCILIIAFIIIPVFALLGSLTTEVIRVYTGVQEHLHSGDFNIVPDKDESPMLNKTVTNALDILKTHETKVKEILTDFSKKMGEFFLKQGTAMFKNVASIIFKAALMVIALFYIFKDGERMLQTLKDLLPLPERDVENFAKVMDDVLSATLYGNLLNGVIQGSLGVLILWSLDFSAALLWGMIMGFTTFIPMIGPALVWFPATIYLLLTGFYLKAAILLVFGILIISQIDNFLRPIFISGKTHIHTLILLFSILGGLSVFGFLGFILGPILMALCVSILELYRLNSLGRIPHK